MKEASMSFRIRMIVLGLTLNYIIEATGLNHIEGKLHKKIFYDYGYNPNVMPQENKQTPVNVTLDMYLMSIDNIDEKRQTITIKAFLEIKWIDVFLTWDINDYPNITTISVKDSDIWVPDISLRDTFDKLTDLGQGEGKANIKNNGLVTIWPYKIYTVACKIAIVKFPFDKQNCKFVFQSWSLPRSILLLNSSQRKPGMNFFTESGVWELTSSKINLTQRAYGDEIWDYVEILFELKRKALYHIVNLILPVVCISILNIVSFALPAASGERVTLSISIFLTLAVFLTTVNSHMPESSDEVASFSIYLGLQLLGSAFTIMSTIVSLNLFHREKTRPIPHIFKMVTKYFEEPRKNEGFMAGAVPNENVKSRRTDASSGTASIVKEMLQCGNVTWKMVSRAMDKICFISAIFWHVILTASLLVSITT